MWHLLVFRIPKSYSWIAVLLNLPVTHRPSQDWAGRHCPKHGMSARERFNLCMLDHEHTLLGDSPVSWCAGKRTGCCMYVHLTSQGMLSKRAKEPRTCIQKSVTKSATQLCLKVDKTKIYSIVWFQLWQEMIVFQEDNIPWFNNASLLKLQRRDRSSTR